ncbi:MULTISPECIES: electron transport complex subunit RsxD [unclassified Brenneria]|uniref:electron transport complex subunit RsxD n=1 Tax=unclassified Brenneria TaxID=2634434 RepID=UPI00155407D9|nr:MULTISPECIES: electron transport complex subunit RsxD [unclassified Brenneria]MBJ7220772.1 electron transport complex subunit RsxD [Brenneria sp. L3-3C-1]MEE3642012.1 electron transport complex subunit RsxD [Brenneria sp. L3_3C_1]MEE3649291.1 electron transport complex subunit RsxD [Brenneria sp. HEZEL_4_2_4]NPC99244.1 electron transport complex subunit RsxD [Brenneria sp. hezel4-2-4]
MAFKIASSPFTHNQQRTQRIMLLVSIACIPGMLAQYYFFGYGNLIQVLLAAVTALAAESVTLSLRKFPVRATLVDNSALLTAILLGISLPPLAPWWMVVMGTAFAIVIAKQLYGGLGQNPFNPAMIGYVVLLISFPVQMTSWLPPVPLQSFPIGFYDTLLTIFTGHTPSGQSVQQLMQTVDGVSQATPLDTFKTALRSGQPPQQILQQPLFSGALAGVGWQWVNIGFLIGGLFLLQRGTIRWHIPVSFLLALTLCATLGWLLAPGKCAPPLLHLLSGATMLGAFFIATDPVTASTTNKGRLIFGALIGLLVWLIRTYGGYPDGIAFAVLLANITVPLIDYYTKPRAYGHHR